MESWEKALDLILGTGDRTPEVYEGDEGLTTLSGELVYDPRDLMDLRIDVHAAMKRMDGRDRALLLLWLMGWTQEELGARVGVTEMAISYRLSTVLTNLRGQLT